MNRITETKCRPQISTDDSLLHESMKEARWFGPGQAQALATQYFDASE